MSQHTRHPTVAYDQVLWQSSTGVLTLTGAASAGNYKAALQAIVYRNDAYDPSPKPRTITYQVFDGTSWSPSQSRTLQFTALNQPPTLTLSSSSPLLFTEGDADLTIDGGLTVADVDNAQLARAYVNITSGVGTGDTLVCAVTTSDIDCTWDKSTSTITLTGPASTANFQVSVLN
eukprot:jgi/Chlat1/5254/Chrsp33S05088